MPDRDGDRDVGMKPWRFHTCVNTNGRHAIITHVRFGGPPHAFLRGSYSYSFIGLCIRH